MNSPGPASEIVPSCGRLPGVCQSSNPLRSDYGYHVEYQHLGRIGGTLEQWEVVIDLFVRDSHSSFVDLLPFVVDMGTSLTIIPRSLVAHNAFPLRKAIVPYAVPVLGVTGTIVFGHTFSATVAIAPPSTRYTPLRFGNLTIVVVDPCAWEEEFGVLGLDALHRVVMVTDREHVTFWRSG